MIYMDLFSGGGNFHKGLVRGGFHFTKTYFSEVDIHAIANYTRLFPDAEFVGSVADIRGADIERPNIITFGSPCQDFSIAGTRKGMDGERSSLISEAIRIITETRPDVFIWENVKGTFSSNSGEDFWAIIKAFANIGGYRLQWQLVNTSWFLPQNRERIFLVGCLTDKCSGEIFPIREKPKRINERAERTATARCLTGGGNSGGMHSSMTLINEAKNLQGKDIVNTIRSGGRGTMTNKHNWDCVQIKQLGRGFNKGGEHDVCPTITKNSFQHNNHVQVGTLRTHKDGEGFRETASGLAPTIPARAREDGSGQPVVAVLTPDRAEKRQNGRRFKQPGEPAFTLTAQDKHGVMLDTPYSMGSGKKGRSCIGTRAPEVGNSKKSIRRLTEIECERLQGAEDDSTKYGMYFRPKIEKYITRKNTAKKHIRINKLNRSLDFQARMIHRLHERNKLNDMLIEKELPATERYRICGNGVTQDVVEAIADRVLDCYDFGGAI